jgi:hypothetical protein
MAFGANMPDHHTYLTANRSRHVLRIAYFVDDGRSGEGKPYAITARTHSR